VSVQYQKHMTHHLTDDVRRHWLGALRHAFLIRDPAQVVASYARVRGEPTLDDIGVVRQKELFDAHGGPVVDAADVLRDPERTLSALCAALGLPWDPAMLSWPPGHRPTDGVWAPHWYASVEASTGFAPFDPTPATVPPHLADLVAEARPFYDALAAHRL
jgi:hypothetical protein